MAEIDSTIKVKRGIASEESSKSTTSPSIAAAAPSSSSSAATSSSSSSICDPSSGDLSAILYQALEDIGEEMVDVNEDDDMVAVAQRVDVPLSPIISRRPVAPVRTLIIHPEDESTNFLSVLYKKIENKSVINTVLSKTDLIRLIDEHDRVMMLGHGLAGGLINVGGWPDFGMFLIDESLVELLRARNDNVYIWCYANGFCERHQLGGFYSGMFISELQEAAFCVYNNSDPELSEKLIQVSQAEVDESNFGFVNIMQKYMHEGKQVLWEHVTREYGAIAETNPIACYNNKRLQYL